MKKIFLLAFIFIGLGCTSSDNENGDDTNIDVVDNGSCTKPDGLQVVDITSNSARFAWGDGNGSQLFNIEYGPRGFSIGNGTRISVNTVFKDITGLSSTTEYDFYVRTNCGGNTYSGWAGPQSFVTN